MLHGIAWTRPGPPDGAPPHERRPLETLCALLTPAGGLLDARPGGDCPIGDLDDAVAAALRRHDALLGAYAEVQDVLPIRFGTCIARLDEAEQVLAAHGVAIADALRHLGGRREFTIRVLCLEPEAAAAQPHDGQGYLAGRLAARNARQDKRRQIDNFLHRLAVGLGDVATLRSLPRPAAPGHRIAAWSCLVRSDWVDRARDVLASMHHEAQTLRLSLTMTGPHAPYSFATQEIATDAGTQ